jgi:hypothetical protein
LRAYVGDGGADSFSGVPQVVATGGTDVSVVMEDCCYIPVFSGVGEAVVFESTNDGRTFSDEIPAGVIPGVDASTFTGGEIVVASSQSTSLNVQALPTGPDVALTAPAHPNAKSDGDTSLSTYDGGVLVASDDTRGDTLVEFAPRGSNFNLTASYRLRVGDFNGEDLAAVSDSALLTYSSTATPGAFLRFFNGKSFGPRYTVPVPAGDRLAYWSLQTTGSLVHVFFLDKTAGFVVCSEATRNGADWSPLSLYSKALTAGALVPVLGPGGSGLVFEADVSSLPAMAQPVLKYQAVAIKLARLRAPAGRRTTLTGAASPALRGELVTLERRIAAGQWSDISATRESPAGKFSFTVPGVSDAYRVKVAYEPGYYLVGYSNTVSLTALASGASK